MKLTLANERFGQDVADCHPAVLDAKVLRTPMKIRFQLLATMIAGVLHIGLEAASVETNAAVNTSFGLRLAEGFRVTEFAGPDLANDIFSMTVDAKGRVVVSGPGYIRTLEDTDHDGRADRAILFADPRTGAMGLCADGNDLIATAEGAVLRYRDANGDGTADGPPEKWLPARFGEHGGHAIRKGPDGAWYFIGGNDSEFGAKHVSSSNSPVRGPVAGALLRFDDMARHVEVIAHGFRNPYDFDFNAGGDLFTYDSDVERDYFLPWYTPTRLYQVAVGAHHGWQLPGYMRSWNRPGYFADAVEPVTLLGRGSPTGVACYRHKMFPQRYRDGVFLADWTFGKVLFCSLRSADSTYRTEPEVFLESVGTEGFAPTDLAVAPDGALLVSIGGRKTRGAVYRITFGEAPLPTRPLASTRARTALQDPPSLESVLDAPQPLDAWSRAQWMPVARQLGAAPFLSAAVNERLTPARRVRAIELCTELWGGLETARAIVAARAKSPLVRARVAWSIGRVPCRDVGLVLLPLAQEPFARVRRAALEALLDKTAEVSADGLQRVLLANLGHRDRGVRLAAAQLAARLEPDVWRALATQVEKAGPGVQMTAAMVSLWRDASTENRGRVLSRVVPLVEKTTNEELLLQAFRVAQIALGDWNLQKPSVEVYTAYELPNPIPGEWKDLSRRLRVAIGAVLPVFDWRTNTEALRLLAMLNDDQPGIPEKVCEFLAERSSATSDFHVLTVLSRLRTSWSDTLPARVTEAVLALDDKLGGQEQRTKQVWSARLTEVLHQLIQQEPRIAELLARHPSLVHSAHVPLVLALPEPLRVDAARRFRTAVEQGTSFPWSLALVEMLGTLPPGEVRPMFRQQWENRSLREVLTRQLARDPEIVDRDRLIEASITVPAPVAIEALTAIEKLSTARDARSAVLLGAALQRWMNEPKESVIRSRLVRVLGHMRGEPFVISEVHSDPRAMREAYEPVFRWLRDRYPEEARLLSGTSEVDLGAWRERLKLVTWQDGRPAVGARIFEQRACQSCHAGAGSLGPDLAGVAGRMSIVDLFTAILAPSQDIAPAYRPTVFQMRDGQSHVGLVAFESADGYIVQTGAATTVRLAEADIAARTASATSLMPDGLLGGITDTELADLYAFLKAQAGSR